MVRNLTSLQVASVIRSPFSRGGGLVHPVVKTFLQFAAQDIRQLTDSQPPSQRPRAPGSGVGLSDMTSVCRSEQSTPGAAVRGHRAGVAWSVACWAGVGLFALVTDVATKAWA